MLGLSLGSHSDPKNPSSGCRICHPDRQNNMSVSWFLRWPPWAGRHWGFGGWEDGINLSLASLWLLFGNRDFLYRPAGRCRKGGLSVWTSPDWLGCHWRPRKAGLCLICDFKLIDCGLLRIHLKLLPYTGLFLKCGVYQLNYMINITLLWIISVETEILVLCCSQNQVYEVRVVQEKVYINTQNMLSLSPVPEDSSVPSGKILANSQTDCMSHTCYSV